MVRILCLHGTGTNAAILKSQLAAVKASLPSEWEWFFVDAETECDASPGVEIWPGPYRNYFIVPSIQTMADVQDWLFDIIDEDGPFDGVFGFSEGGALAYSVMIRHQEDHPFDPPLFRFAIFSGSSLPWMGTPNHGIDMTPLVVRRRPFPVELPELKARIAEAEAEPFANPSTTEAEGVAPALRRGAMELAKKPFVYEEYITYRMHPDHDSGRLQIPTAHLLGKNDFAYEGGKKLRQLCDSRYTLTWEHNAGHSIPRGGADVVKIKEMIEKTVARSEFVS